MLPEWLIFILMFGLIQGALLLLVLLIRKRLEIFHLFLSAYITVLVFQLLFKVMAKFWLMDHLPQIYSLSYYLPFLYGPLIWLFAKSYLIHDDRLKWFNLIHLLPFITYLAFFGIFGNQFDPPSFWTLLFSAKGRLWMEAFSLLAYHAAVWKLTNYQDLAISGRIPSSRVIFVKKFTVVSLLITGLVTAALYFLYIYFPHYQLVRWIFSLLALFVYWISYEALKKPELFRVLYGNNRQLSAEFSIPFLKVHTPAKKYANSSLKNEEASRILQRLAKLMDEEKIYLDPELTFDIVSEKINCQKHHLSQVLNEQLQKSFHELIQEKRVGEAKIMLSDPAFNHIKISSIAFDAGFNSLSSFNETFRKIAGVAPSGFRQSARRNERIRMLRG